MSILRPVCTCKQDPTITCRLHPYKCEHGYKPDCLRCRIAELEAKVERQADALRKISDIAETGNMEWVIDTAQAALENE